MFFLLIDFISHINAKIFNLIEIMIALF